MQERRNKQRIVLFIVLLCATAFAYWFTSKREKIDDVDKTIFKNFDLNTIDSISLESPKGNVVLTYNGSRWRVNGKFAADASMIDVLFATLQQAEPRRPLAMALRDSVVLNLKETGVKVSLTAAGTVIESFFAGGNVAKIQAYFLDTEGDTPYLMTIPGYRVYVSGIFELPESGWRDKIVFGFNWRNFQRLEMSFPERPSDNFVVAMDKNYFSIQGLTQVDTTKLNDFLDDVSLLSVEDYLMPNEISDSLSGVHPIVSVVVTDIGKREYRLRLYRPIGPGRQWYGLIDETQWALFQENKMGAVIRPRNFFVK